MSERLTGGRALNGIPSEFVVAKHGDVARLLRLRYAFVAFVAGCGGVLAGGRGDWNYFVELGRTMFSSDGLRIYVTHGDAQTGPLSLVVAAALSLTPRSGFVACVVICGLVGLACLRLLDLGGNPQRAADAQAVAVLTGGIILASWWSLLGGFGHLDDALVLLGAVFALGSYLDGRPMAAALAIGLGIAIKPWAVIFLPLTAPRLTEPDRIGAVGNSSLRDRVIGSALALRGPFTASAVACVFWLPFLVAYPATLRTLRPTVLIAPDSVLAVLRLGDIADHQGFRIAQLATALLAGLVAIRRGQPEWAILAPIAVRVASDPGAWTYYTAGVVVGALAWDLSRPSGVLPRWTIITSMLLLPSWAIPYQTVRGMLRLALCLVVLAMMFIRQPRATRAFAG
jgi:hypothetical protein